VSNVHPVGQSEISPELQHCVDWLQCYFMKPESISALPLPTLHNPLMQSDSFKAHVLWTLFKEVRLGKMVSYKLLAEMIGNPKAVRAVGSAMKNNPIPLIVPCHRVLRSSGDSGSYIGGKGDDIKVWLLTHEKKHWSSMHQTVKNPSDGPQNHFTLLLSLSTNFLFITFFD
ncbi:methylated-DNA--protein-cysteine methyltransferase-like, partial [Sinocyclocheilus grahami]|uniref:methylated-DNA--protein-cysteine methyltransferase-like n=1 Tax=Sinocyclocheilus grahami TaxID=75366 RepID=UPI0007ACA0DA